VLKLLAVGVGGMIGALARYGLSLWIAELSESKVPYGTFTVNVLGCLLIGFFMGWFARRPDVPDATRLLVITGILGSLTTFSTFGYETMTLVRDEEWRAFFIYFGANIIVGLSAVELGRVIANKLAG